MDKGLEAIALEIKPRRGRNVVRGEVFDGGMDDGIVVLGFDGRLSRACCVRVNLAGLRTVRISVDRLRREHARLGENDAAAVIRQMHRHLAKKAERQKT